MEKLLTCNHFSTMSCLESIMNSSLLSSQNIDAAKQSKRLQGNPGSDDRTVTEAASNDADLLLDDSPGPITHAYLESNKV